jgi:hypothetical protein
METAKMENKGVVVEITTGKCIEYKLDSPRVFITAIDVDSDGYAEWIMFADDEVELQAMFVPYADVIVEVKRMIS